MMKKSILLPILTLAIVAVVLLAATFGLHAITEANTQKIHLELMKTLIPGSETITLEPYSGDDANIRSVHKGETGFVIETVTTGYAGDITMFIGVANDGTVTGLRVWDMSETMGLGSNALFEETFLAQFLNTKGNVAIGVQADAFSSATGETETTGEETYVDGITGATVTSKAIAKAVNSAAAYVTGADTSSGATSWGG